MVAKVSYSRGGEGGDVAVLVIDNPPVNALSAVVRRQLWEAVERADADAGAEAGGGVRAVVIRAAGRTFPVGADIREFARPPVPPSLGDLCRRIEDMRVPVVVALHGNVLGGGFELALAAHYRIADNAAGFGLPEVTLGVLPGAGGTQRIPRLAGAGAALDLMLSGKPIRAARAHELGLVDRLVEDNLEGAAIEWAGELARSGAGVRRSRERREGLADPIRFMSEVKERRAAVPSGPLPAPARIVDCVEAALLVPFDIGLAMERTAFEDCVASDQARALRHAFFAERRAAKVPELRRVRPREVGRVGVVGAGLMGAGIARVCLDAGLPVTLVERDEAALGEGRARLHGLYRRAVMKGQLSADQARAQLGRLTPGTDMAGLGGADVIFEAVPEDEEVKRAVFGALDRVMKPGAILASNTSYLDIDMLAAGTSRPEDVLGFHFFSPVQAMGLVEVVVGSRTDEEVVATGFALAQRLGKIPVRAGVCDGFIGNRILAAWRQAADFMLEDGASPYQIDEAMRAYGFVLGPYQVLDLAGLGISWARRKRLAAQRPADERYVRIGDLLCERGWLGRQAGRGYYRYEDGAHQGRPDAEVLALIEAERSEKGISPRAFAPEEIQARCLAAMANEGARLLQEGVALRPSDIDVVLLHGYGFPRWRGGPMMAADLSGLLTLANALKGWAATEGAFWQPAPLLGELIKNGRHFDDMN